MVYLNRRFSYVNRLCKYTNIDGSHNWSACVNEPIIQAVLLREPSVLIDLYKRFHKQTACALSSYKYHQPGPFFDLGRNCSSQPPSIIAHLRGPDFPKYKGEVLIFISWKEVAK
jgi:hypothetical protein